MNDAGYLVESDPYEESFEEMREGIDLGKMSGNRRETEGDGQRRSVGLQVNMDEESLDDAQTKDSRISGLGENDPSTWSTAATRGKTWGRTIKKKVRGLRRSKKKKSLGYDAGPSFARGKSKCLRCGRSHKGVCLVGMTGCYRCGQEGHVMRECSFAPQLVQSQGADTDRAAQAVRQGGEADTSDTSVPD